MTSKANKAAFLVAKGDIRVQDARQHSVGPDEVLVEVHSVAVNPVDERMATQGLFIKAFPSFLGHDLAGKVVSVGNNVQQFSPGDRVLGFAYGSMTGKNEEAAYQKYAPVKQHATIKLPESVSFNAASTLPLCLATAAAGLYHNSTLGLPLPSAGGVDQRAETILIYGGSSSVGANAIQLAKASGYQVATIASKRNEGLVKECGAELFFDRSDSSLVDGVNSALKGKKLAAVFDTISSVDTLVLCSKIAAANDLKQICGVKPRMERPAEVAEGVELKQAFSTTIFGGPIGEHIFGNFIPKALANGSYIAKPDPRIIGSGLEAVAKAIDEYAKGGVSGEKLVVEKINE